MADVVPSSPTKAELPRAPEPLQKELVHFDAVNLRHQEPKEKIVLPDKLGITSDILQKNRIYFIFCETHFICRRCAREARRKTQTNFERR